MKKMIMNIIKIGSITLALGWLLSGCASGNTETVFGVPLSTWNSLSETQQREIIRGYYYGRAPKKTDQQLMNIKDQ